MAAGSITTWLFGMCLAASAARGIQGGLSMELPQVHCLMRMSEHSDHLHELRLPVTIIAVEGTPVSGRECFYPRTPSVSGSAKCCTSGLSMRIERSPICTGMCVVGRQVPVILRLARTELFIVMIAAIKYHNGTQMLQLELPQVILTHSMIVWSSPCAITTQRRPSSTLSGAFRSRRDFYLNAVLNSLHLRPSTMMMW